MIPSALPIKCLRKMLIWFPPFQTRSSNNDQLPMLLWFECEELPLGSSVGTLGPPVSDIWGGHGAFGSIHSCAGRSTWLRVGPKSSQPHPAACGCMKCGRPSQHTSLTLWTLLLEQ